MTGTFVFLFAYLFNCGLFHCRHSCIAILVSGKGCHSRSVIGIICEQLTQIATLKKMRIWSSKLNCWCCYNVDFGWSSDWIFECAVFGLLGPTSEYFLHGLTYFNNGEPQCVNNSRTSLFNAFKAGIQRENFNINFQEKRDSNWTGYCLTNNDIVKYWSETIFKPEFDNRKARCRADNWQRRSYRVRKRRAIAKVKSIPVLYGKHVFIYKMKTELFHAFDTWQGTLFRYIVYFTHVSCQWSLNDTMKIVDEIEVTYLSNQVRTWLNTVGSRNLKKTMQLRTDGTGYKKICQRLPQALWRGMWLCNDYEEPVIQEFLTNGEEVDKSTFFPNVIFCSLWNIHYHSRRMWSIMWQTFIKCPPDGSEPVEITQMYQNAESAGINIHETTPGMVSTFVYVFRSFVDMFGAFVDVFAVFFYVFDAFIDHSFVLIFGEHFVWLLMNFIII